MIYIYTHRHNIKKKRTWEEVAKMWGNAVIIYMAKFSN